MKTFTDVAGRTWELSLTIGAVKRIKSLTSVDLLDIMGGKPPLLTRLGLDLALAIDVAFALVKPKADELGVNDEVFAEALGGDAALAALTALYEEMADFFQKLGRPHEAKAIQKQTATIRAAVRAAEAKIEAIQVDAVVERAMAGDSSGN